jgi:hypothetical protein
VALNYIKREREEKRLYRRSNQNERMEFDYEPLRNIISNAICLLNLGDWDFPNKNLLLYFISFFYQIKFFGRLKLFFDKKTNDSYSSTRRI